MSYSNAPVLVFQKTFPAMVKRIAMASMAGLLLAACASKPIPIASTDAYAVQSVTVSSTASDTRFKTSLQDALAGQFSGGGSGLESELNITVTNVRFGGSFTSILYGSANGATMHVIVRSTKTGLKLRDFRFSVTSNATDRDRARSQMVEKARAELKNIFRARVKPAVITKQRKAVKSKAKAKPISLDPIGDLEKKTPKAAQAPVVTPVVEKEKPKLVPIAEAAPVVKPEPKVEIKAPEIKPQPAAPVVEARKVEAAPVEPEPSPVESSDAGDPPAPSTSEPAAEEEALCVVTLENDCSE